MTRYSGLGGFMVFFAAACSSAAPLEQADLARPERVVQKLRREPAAAERQTADTLYRQAQSLLEKNGGRNWGPVVKAFAESAVLRPTPAALKGYAWATLQKLEGVVQSEARPGEGEAHDTA